MRRQLAALALCLSTALAATPTAAETSLSAEIGANGIQPTIDRLTALPAPTDADRFALGGLLFLRAAEETLQARWKVGYSNRTTFLPLLRLPVPGNPDPAPFQASLIASIFRNAGQRMEEARAQLAQIPAGSDFGLEIAFKDLWFDTNENGKRDAGEGLFNVAGSIIDGRRWRGPETPPELPVVRFDVADAAWLSAYTHMLSSISEAVLAYDPTASIARVMAARAAMIEIGPPDLRDNFGLDDFPDTLAAVLGALNQTPDAAHAAKARDELLAMIADNRRFWDEVAKETDNNQEWIPNDTQQSALGIRFPKGLGAAWLEVLSEGEAMLNGEHLMRFWRVGAGGGINVKKLFTEPRPIDMVGWFQGWAALPYLEKGPLADGLASNRFSALALGQSTMLMILLN